tara:strand:+ start:340 stop:495 length:156 start_codon:yes stop_codon:yes gene_type:complete
MNNLSLIEKHHQLEKLEFALALSQAIGDKIQADRIREKMNKIGLKYEEPVK